MASLLLSFPSRFIFSKEVSALGSHTMEMMSRNGWRIVTWLLTPILYQPNR
ncbi:hypothetical protein AtNW77_Chr2g0254991 [Arabidopsis thaliana]|uniref:Uncharacterized protein n=2 Tax=Arabidopsis thaliana TaxID=3702 RepID=A0A654EYR7_ARATH|nr:uncharacterized protein AT2G34325 [Arabidopsis thaliana]ANM62499.1 hypothetical protein AT2G34325 [Arabidopsis thaliana]CAA0374550.1 unnamed protein product [Arabidopsis thaliana]VYS54416.1 unnamed protein product [Arabidopsis thaliana]|eukprot:NP_001324653.1 hypothetical protein AT2G34325 [Arabidopsis thaliana]